MTPRWIALLGLGFVLAVGGCADHPSRKPDHAAPPQPGATGSVTRPRPALPSHTGIPACDEYLASYVACHRAAGIFPPDQIAPHFREMRRTLLGDSVDPDIRPQLATRCNALARSLRQALHGKSCTPAAPVAGDGP